MSIHSFQLSFTHVYNQKKKVINCFCFNLIGASILQNCYIKLNFSYHCHSVKDNLAQKADSVYKSMGVDRRIGIREIKKMLFEFIMREKYLSSTVITTNDQ